VRKAKGFVRKDFTVGALEHKSFGRLPQSEGVRAWSMLVGKQSGALCSNGLRVIVVLRSM
jgi:hypothetical protein